LQPIGLECWESATFNDSTCLWEVSGTQPIQPTELECWETTSFNTTTCSWDISGTQPLQPTGLECWETSTFNDNICLWEVTGIQPQEPTNLECWQIATFNDESCSWEISGEQIIDFEEEFFTICEGEDIALQANTSIINATYLWNTGETTASITVNMVGTYSVVTTDGCSAVEKTIIVEQTVSPVLESIQSDGSNILVFTSNIGNFLYSLDGINYQTSNIFFNVDGGHYDVYIKSADCDIIITISYIHFYIPKFITPNDDTVNDTFKLSGLESYSSSEVYIFDRFGKLLFSAKNRSVNWTGTFKNRPLPTSDYWYLIIIEGQEFRGHFTLKR
ncbi:T9SS type B sorting domain-containing protein, partial [Psychroserpens sp. AS72]|uniref:T9SS type B sorting domain-containing protein n=1 Tax=Psychroserpens sp. AS72 TaxID=3135775 RepID=UPI003178CB39